MTREIEKIKMLVNYDNIIEGILIECFENHKHKYYAEHVDFIFTKEDEKDFNLLVTKILFDSNCNKKTKFVYLEDENYYDTFELIRKNKIAHSDEDEDFLQGFLTLYSFIIKSLPITALAGILSAKRLYDVNKRIKVFEKSARLKTKRKFYATILAINLLSSSIHGYKELTKIQFEKDIDDSIENPFDLDIDYNEDDKIELLMAAIKQNPNLEDDDKNILYRFKDLLEDNPYVDYQKLYDKFAKLKIIYTEEKNIDYAAAYFVENNYIIDYDYKNDGDYHQEEISYLLMRLIGSFEDYPCLSKGMQKFLTKHYITKDVLNTYSETVARLMLIIVGNDKVFEAYSTSDFGIIEKELKKINSDEDDYNQLISILKKKDWDENKSSLSEIYDAYIQYITPVEKTRDSKPKSLQNIKGQKKT